MNFILTITQHKRRLEQDISVWYVFIEIKTNIKERRNLMESKMCSSCKEVLPLEEFYYYAANNTYFSKCKDCTSEERRRKHSIGMSNSERSLWAINKNKPGDFANDTQKVEVHKLLEAIGWLHNVDKNLWYKKGIKDANGNWKRIKTKKKKVEPERKKRVVYDVQKMITLRREGYKLVQIGEIMDCSKPTVSKYLKKYGEKRTD